MQVLPKEVEEESDAWVHSVQNIEHLSYRT
jgi:hypothetical protein